MGQGLAGRETQGLNILQFGQRMQLKNFACVWVRPRVCICVCVRPHASACVQKIKRPDASGCKNFCVQTRLLFKDFQDVLYIAIYLSVHC